MYKKAQKETESQSLQLSSFKVSEKLKQQN